MRPTEDQDGNPVVGMAWGCLIEIVAIGCIVGLMTIIKNLQTIKTFIGL